MYGDWGEGNINPLSYFCIQLCRTGKQRGDQETLHTVMERDHCLVAGWMLTAILLSVLNTNCPTASRPGLDMFLSLTQET